MHPKIIADSCCDLNPKMQKELDVELIPFKMLLDGTTHVDDASLDAMAFLNVLKSSPNVPKSSCPSPEDFLNAFKASVSNNIFVITISSLLSGAYNSAMTAKNIFMENNKDTFVHIFDSLSASTAEILVVLKIRECADKNLSVDDLVSNVTQFISGMHTFFILDSLDNLIKNGRMSKFKGFLASVLNIVPIMKTNNGEIDLEEKVRGSKKAFNRLVEIIGETGTDFADKVLAITHCNAKQKAEDLKAAVAAQYNFKDILVLETKGLSTMYAYDGGVIVSF